MKPGARGWGRAVALALGLGVSTVNAAGAVPAFEGDAAALATDGERLFVGAFDRGVYEVAPGKAAVRLEDPALNPNVNALLVDPVERRLFVATARGVVRCGLGESRKCERIGRRSSVHALLKLRSGVVLAGGDDGVLAIGRGGETAEYSRKLGAPYRSVWALAELGDTVFVGATNGLHFASRDVFSPSGAGKPVMQRAGMLTGDLPDDWVTAIAADGPSLHVGTYNSGVTSFRLQGGKLTRLGGATSLGYVNPAGIAPLGDGRLAVATMDGLAVGAGEAWTKVPAGASDVTAVLAVPGKSTHWIATRRGVTERALPAP